MIKISKGIFDVPLVLSDSLKLQENVINQTMLNAQNRIVEFAKKYGFSSLVEPSFIERVEIFDTQEALKKCLMTVLDYKGNIDLPRTFSAALENKVLMSLSPKAYQNIYPIEGEDPLGFERLLTHEIAHRLHTRILNGNEEAMGPTWFFEGFAIFVSNQFPNYTCSETIMWDIIKNQKQVSYKYFAAIFRYLIEHISLIDLINHAEDIKFYEWLKKHI